MDTTLAATIIASCSSLFVALVSIFLNNRIIGYKVDELEKKVEKHNNIVERVAILERTTAESFSTVWRRYDDMNEEMERRFKEIKDEIRDR